MSKELNKLIEQVLTEREWGKLPIGVPKTLTPDFQKDLGDYTKKDDQKSRYYQFLQKLANSESPANELSDEDLIHFIGPKTGKDDKFANNPNGLYKDLIAKLGTGLAGSKSFKNNLKNWINTAFVKTMKQQHAEWKKEINPNVKAGKGEDLLSRYRNNFGYTGTAADNQIIKKFYTGFEKSVRRAENKHWSDERYENSFNKDPKSNEWKAAWEMLSSLNKESRVKAENAYASFLNKTAGEKNVEPEQLHKAFLKLVGSSKEPYFQPLGTEKFPQASLAVAQEDVFGWKEGSPALVTANPSLVNTFDAIAGDSVASKLNNIRNFAEALNTDTLDQWVKKNGELSYITYARVIALLADSVAAASATDAGGEFERWLTLLLNIPVVGAEQGAADNMGKITGGKGVITSAKMYSSICGKEAPSQSTEGLAAQKEFDQPGDNMYYFVGHKIKGEQSDVISGEQKIITDINFYLIELERIDSTNIKGRLIKADKTASEWYPCRKNVQKTGINQTLLFPCGSENKPSGMSEPEVEKYAFIKIPIMTKEFQELFTSKRLVATTADYLASLTEGEGFEGLAKAVVESYKNIQAVEASTTNYYSAKTKGEQNPTDYINDVGSKVVQMRSQLNKIFALAGEAGQKPGTKAPKELVESELSLDQLIEEVVKQKLLK